MKKILSIAVLAVSLTVIGSNAQMQWGFAGGLNIANADITGGGTSVSTSSITSFYAGIIGIKSISEKMNFQTGALFSGKGVKSTDVDIEINPMYIELPLNLQFVLESGSMKILPYGGFYLGFGVMGKIKGGGQEQDIKFGDSATDDMKRMDYGLAFGVTFDLGNRFLINGQYQMGLANLANATSVDVKTKTMSLGIGYMFGQ
jgi:hypothetical protein